MALSVWAQVQADQEKFREPKWTDFHHWLGVIRLYPTRRETMLFIAKVAWFEGETDLADCRWDPSWAEPDELPAKHAAGFWSLEQCEAFDASSAFQANWEDEHQWPDELLLNNTERVLRAAPAEAKELRPKEEPSLVGETPKRCAGDSLWEGWQRVQPSDCSEQEKHFSLHFNPALTRVELSINQNRFFPKQERGPFEHPKDQLFFGEQCAGDGPKLKKKS